MALTMASLAVLQVRGGGRLEGDVHRGGRAEAALLGTDGDLSGAGYLGEFGPDRVLELALVGLFIGHYRERRVRGAGGE